jgi:hypothetical protein
MSSSLLHRRVSTRFDRDGNDDDEYKDGDDGSSSALGVTASISGEQSGFHRRLVVAVDATTHPTRHDFDFDVVGVRVVVPREAFVDADELRELSTSGWECAAIGDVDVEAPARRAGEATLTCARAAASASASASKSGSSWTLDVPIHARYGVTKLGGGKSRVEFTAPVRATALTTDGRWVDGVQSANALKSASLGWEVPVGDAGSADAVRWITDGVRAIGAVIVLVFALGKRMRRTDRSMKRVKNN